jgi:TatD DNase family protein
VLVDTHCHLNFNSFDADRPQVLARARESGVTKMLNPGIDLLSSQAAVELARSEDQVYVAVGVHPNEAKTWQSDTIERLRQLSTNQRVVAVGEIGLDYHRDRAPASLQRQVFQAQLTLAGELGLPVVVHNREATGDVLGMLLEWQRDLESDRSPLAERPGVLHSYSDTLEHAWQAISQKFYIGFTGPLTFRNALELQKIATTLPLAHILVETDAPFLTPHPYRGKRNEPAHVRFVVEKIAELRQIEFTQVASITTANAKRLFQW